MLRVWRGGRSQRTRAVNQIPDISIIIVAFCFLRTPSLIITNDAHYQFRRFPRRARCSSVAQLAHPWNPPAPLTASWPSPPRTQNCRWIAILLARIVNLQAQRCFHLRLRPTGIPPRHRGCEIVIKARGDSHVCVGHGQTARRIVPPPADSRQIGFSPRVHVGILPPGRRALISADEPGGNSHYAASIAEQDCQIPARSLLPAQSLIGVPGGTVGTDQRATGLKNLAAQR